MIPLAPSRELNEGERTTMIFDDKEKNMAYRKQKYLWVATVVLVFGICPIQGDGEFQKGRSQKLAEAIVIGHGNTKLSSIPQEWIKKAKEKLHIAYGHSSHGSQLATGMIGLSQWKGPLYAWNSTGLRGALDLRDYSENFGNLNIANDLGNPNRTAWEKATRIYLAQNPDVNVMMWSWCWQVDGSEAEIRLYLELMNKLEKDYPGIMFIYMTGHVNGDPPRGNPWERNVSLRNQQIRDYCLSNKKILYDFADIESYDPDGNYFGDKRVNDNCDYDSNGDGIRDRNWAVDWQRAHPDDWYDCPAAHTQPLNANLKAYAAWWLWARVAGWDGVPN